MPIYFTSNDTGQPLYIQSIGNHWNQGTVERERGFPYYHWLQTESGSGMVFINGTTLRLERGTGVLVPPLLPHSYKPERSGWQTSFVTFCGRLHHMIGSLVNPDPYALARESEFFSFQGWADKIVRQFERGEQCPEELSIECFRFLTYLGAAQEQRLPLTHHAYLKYIAPSLTYIHEKYGTPIVLEELARHVFVTPQYLSRLFRRFLNVSVHEYITGYRVKRAKELLTSRPELPVKTVSIMVGMSTVSHFIAVFKQRVGCTPLGFRNFHG